MTQKQNNSTQQGRIPTEGKQHSQNNKGDHQVYLYGHFVFGEGSAP